MTLPRIAACFTIPAALLLSACGGGSSSPFVNNATQGTAQVRFVQADPKFGPLDIYFFQSAGSQTTTPAFSSLAFGEASDYQPQTAVPNTLVARTAGSASSGPGVTACNLPPLTNANYSVVIADQNGAPNCMVFQDQNYSTTLQYRMQRRPAHPTGPCRTETDGCPQVGRFAPCSTDRSHHPAQHWPAQRSRA